MTPQLAVFLAVAVGSLLGFIRIYVRGKRENSKVSPLIFLTYPVYLAELAMLIFYPTMLDSDHSDIPFLFLFLSLAVWLAAFRKEVLPHASPFLVLSTLFAAVIAAVTMPVIGSQLWPVFVGFLVIALLFLSQRRVAAWYAIYVIVDLGILALSAIPMVLHASVLIYDSLMPDFTDWLMLTTSALILPGALMTAAYVLMMAPGKREARDEYDRRIKQEEAELRGHEFRFLTLTPEETLFAAMTVAAFSVCLYLFPDHRILVINAAVLLLGAFDGLFSKVRKRADAATVMVHVLPYDGDTGTWFVVRLAVAMTARWNGLTAGVEPEKAPDAVARTVLTTATGWSSPVTYIGSMTLEEADEIGEKDKCVALYAAIASGEPPAPSRYIGGWEWKPVTGLTDTTASPMIMKSLQLLRVLPQPTPVAPEPATVA
jgi:hypothetical protein